MARATGNSQSDFRMKSETNVTNIQRRSDGHDQLYAMRRMHIESLHRFANEIDDLDRLQALDEDDLAIRQETFGTWHNLPTWSGLIDYISKYAGLQVMRSTITSRPE